ncbi:MAG: cob(I)yrinic acid a,c-diamide adenosyltransferase [Ignavibacteria bacterium]|nr:cob(I)yrinic acid a,c-diamide adenosyltransferase [Ignavibacteria bacterium]
MKIYTKSGDEGRTSLFDGTRVSKENLRVEAYGCVDELNAYIGVISTFDLSTREKESLQKISKLLFSIGTDLATPDEKKLPKDFNRINEKDVAFLENLIDDVNEKLPELQNFILPGGCFESAFTHIARTVCRRAERRVVELKQKERINHHIIAFLNRLSDFLFVFARYLNLLKGIEDNIWKRDD